MGILRDSFLREYFGNTWGPLSDNLGPIRLAQLSKLSRSEFPDPDPELFSHGAYDKFFVTFPAKVPYLAFCDKMRQFLIKEMDREEGNKEKMGKCRE